MIKLIEKVSRADNVDASLTLPLEHRIKSRLRVTLDNGEEAGVLLERGATLKDADLLCSEDGYIVMIRAADETVSVVDSEDTHLLARACYHLGNRHVQIQIEPHRISYLHDHVLDEMLTGLGFDVSVTESPFEPEPGAYGGSASQAGHHHGHGHSHDYP